MSIFFDEYPEFILKDTRKDRKVSTVNAESLSHRHEISLPSRIVKGQTILDLGSCIGATGQWCLSSGALHYTGVEAQLSMIEKSNDILSRYWKPTQFSIVKNNIIDFLEECVKQQKKYDVVVMVGVVYAFLDMYNLLKLASQVCNNYIIIDCLYAANVLPTEPVISITHNQYINSDYSNKSYCGLGSRITPAGLRLLMESLNFKDESGLLHPHPLSDKSIHDTYNTLVKFNNLQLPNRYMIRFIKSNIPAIKSVSDIVISEDSDHLMDMPDSPTFLTQTPTWTFDESVADRFQSEAINHIPDYEKVIDLCISYTEKIYNNKNIRIIDVGSALGHTLEKFVAKGYNNIHGVDNSQNMIDRSKFSNKIFKSDDLPAGPWNVILANWTLHFIKHEYEYLQNVYNNLEPGGIFILTNKMEHNLFTEELYHDFKKINGISDQEILNKKQSLIGILNTKPTSWYFENLKKIGFINIELINANLMFHTIYASK